MQFILDVFILLIPYYTGYFVAKNNGINFALQILLFVITLPTQVTTLLTQILKFL